MSGARSSSSEESSEEEEPGVPVSQELLLDELSADTMAALQSHLQRAEESSESEEEDGGAGVSENFGLSQFWVFVRASSRSRTNAAVLLLSLFAALRSLAACSTTATRRDG